MKKPYVSVQVRLPVPLYEAVKVLAVKKNRSMNKQIIEQLENDPVIVQLIDPVTRDLVDGAK
jgi:hypothetical protein